MERVRHARIPVHLDGVLISERTVPKVCKVRNVSDKGMLLACSADGRIPIFSRGDHVDIHLLFRRTDGTKYSTTSAIVRHVDANGIGVEFSQPDARLVDLIESYRIDDTQVLGASVAHLEEVADPGRLEAPVTGSAAGLAASSATQQPSVEVSSRRYYYLGLLSLVMAVGIVTAGYLGTFGFGKRMRALESLTRGYDSEQHVQARTDGGIRGGPGDPGATMSDASGPALEPVRTVGGSARGREPGSVLSTGLGEAPDPAGMAAAPAAGIPVAANRPTAARVEAAADTSQESGFEDRGAHAGEPRGPWVINLLSSPRKADADRFAARARKRGIPVEQSNVRLRGREYFRVQLTGFQTEKQARDNAGPVKEELGLEKVWIFKP
jgi:hypothetical protein